MCLEIFPNIGHILKMKYLNYALEELWFVHNRNIAMVYTPTMKFYLKESHNILQVKQAGNSSWKETHNIAAQLEVGEEPGPGARGAERRGLGSPRSQPGQRGCVKGRWDCGAWEGSR